MGDKSTLLGTDPRISEWQLQMLSKIFRVIIKELVTDDDKAKLAPGEVGIHYGEGAFYVRNPHTGELFSPNSLSHLKQILSKFNPKTGRLNADYVSNIRFYSDIHQLDDLGISLTPDSIIRQMCYPSILVSSITYDNYAEMGFPSSAGIVQVAKLSEEFVTIEYYDCNSFITYEGKYNRFNHLFEGWLATSATSSEFRDAVGGGDNISITTSVEIKDLMIITVRLTEDLNPGATITVNSMPPVPIINADGSRLAQTITANNIIMLIYDEKRNSWVLIPTSMSAMEGLVELLRERINSTEKSFNDTLKAMKESFDNRCRDIEETVRGAERRLSDKIDHLFARPGNIVPEVVVFTATEDTVEVRPIGTFRPAIDKLMIVNYGQTLLRQDIDYTILEANDTGIGGIALINDIVIHPEDTIQFIILKQEEIVPENKGESEDTESTDP